MLFSAKRVEGFPMFSPLNIRVEEWFRRLKKALWRLPGNEREKMHQELRQHLESLVVQTYSGGF